MAALTKTEFINGISSQINCFVWAMPLLSRHFSSLWQDIYYAF